MLRHLAKLLGLAVMLVVATSGMLYYQHAYSTTHQIEQLQDEKKELEQVVTRLSTERRVADVLVSHQEKNASGVLQTTLLFVEYDKQGDTLPARSFTIQGDIAHIDAMIIKFDNDLVQKNDPLRGHSIALFTKIYGDHQNPADAQMIDTPDKIPDVYRGTDPRISQFEMSLWKNFWKMYEDPAYRKEMNVRVLGGHGIWGPFEPNKLYTITLETAGGLNMTSEPLKGIYREALKDHVETTVTTRPALN